MKIKSRGSTTECRQTTWSATRISEGDMGSGRSWVTRAGIWKLLNISGPKAVTDAMVKSMLSRRGQADNMECDTNVEGSRWGQEGHELQGQEFGSYWTYQDRKQSLTPWSKECWAAEARRTTWNATRIWKAAGGVMIEGHKLQGHKCGSYWKYQDRKQYPMTWRSKAGGAMEGRWTTSNQHQVSMPSQQHLIISFMCFSPWWSIPDRHWDPDPATEVTNNHRCHGHNHWG